MKISAAITTTFFVLTGFFTQAQLLDPGRLMKRKAEERINRKMEEAVDKALDKAMTPKKEGDSSGSGENNTADKLLKSLDLGGTPSPVYHFSSSMIMKTITTNPKNKKTSTMRAKYMFSEDGSALCNKFLSSDDPDMAKATASMEGIIFDFGQKKVFTFMNDKGNKSMMAIGFGGEALKEHAAKENAKMEITKTSETRTIAGHVCEGYRLKNEGEEMMLWISRDRIPQMASVASKMGYGSSYGNKNPSKNYMTYGANPELVKIAGEGRMVMGYSARSAKGEESTMELEEINANDKNTFETSGYKSMLGSQP